MHRPMLTAPFLLVSVLALGACDQKHDTIDIASAQAKSALALSAFECSHLAANKSDASRLFSVAVLNGREFLDFAEHNTSGFKSIETQIDPIWSTVADRPSPDFKLGEINAATIGRVFSYRGRWNDSEWTSRRDAMFAERNCAFLGQDKKKD